MCCSAPTGKHSHMQASYCPVWALQLLYTMYIYSLVPRPSPRLVVTHAQTAGATPPGVHPTSTSRDVSDQAFHSLSNFYCVLRCACGEGLGTRLVYVQYASKKTFRTVGNKRRLNGTVVLKKRSRDGVKRSTPRFQRGFSAVSARKRVDKPRG